MKKITFKAYKSFTIDIKEISNCRDVFRTEEDHDARVTITQDIVEEGRRHSVVGIFTCKAKFISSELEKRGYITKEEVIRTV
jgi:hypothetical protein